MSKERQAGLSLWGLCVCECKREKEREIGTVYVSFTRNVLKIEEATVMSQEPEAEPNHPQSPRIPKT